MTRIRKSAKSEKQAKSPEQPWGQKMACVLQCVTDPENPKEVRNFWTIHRSGDYAWDCLIGQALARDMLEKLPAHDICEVFRSIVRDMIAGGSRSMVRKSASSARSGVRSPEAAPGQHFNRPRW